MGQGGRVVDGQPVEPAQCSLVSYCLTSEDYHRDKVVLGGPSMGSEPVGAHAFFTTAGPVRFHPSLVIGMVSGLSCPHLFPLDPAH